MFGRSIRVARIAGIPVGISPWWLVIVALLTWSVGVDFFEVRDPSLARVTALALALASVLAIFAGILAHEFAHALVARRAGVEIKEIDLWLLGGVARMRNQPRRASDELRFALAGPAVTAVLVLAFGALAWALPSSAPAVVRAFVDYQLQVNAAIVVLNLLPALPLDGGRVARAIIWRWTGELRGATVIAAYGGLGLGYAMVGLGILAAVSGYLAGLWAVMLGFFLVIAAAAERRQVEYHEAIDGLMAAEVMSAPAVTMPAALPLVDVRHAARGYRFASFPVVDSDGTVLGLLPLARAISSHGETAGEAAVRDHDLLLGPDEPAEELLERAAFLEVGRAVVVDSEGRPLGVISVSDIQRRAREQTARSAPPRDRHAPAPPSRLMGPRR